jgi:hypothetical protein
LRFARCASGIRAYAYGLSAPWRAVQDHGKVFTIAENKHEPNAEGGSILLPFDPEKYETPRKFEPAL